METITYLIANYNNEKYIPDCMESILRQNSKNWKCLICDDASTDSSVLLFKTYLNNKNIELIINEKNMGYTKTLKKLIDKADTDIVGIVDPDDAIYPEATEYVLNVYNKNNDAGFVYSTLDIYDENFSRFIVENGGKIEEGKTSLESGFVSHLKTFRKKYYYKTSGYDEKFLYCEDRDLVHKMEEVTELIFIDKPLYKYRLRPNSASNDVKNQSVMLSNYFNAVVEALNRRNITGFERIFYLIHFKIVFIKQNVKYPKIIRNISKKLERGGNFLDRVFKIRSGGDLRRQ